MGRSPNPAARRSVEVALRNQEMARMRAESRPYREIAEKFGISVATAHEGVQNAIRDGAREATEEIRALEMDRLENLERAALEILGTVYYAISHGQVVEGAYGPIPDPAPALGAIDRLLKIQQRRAALLGLDLPKQVQVSGGVRYEVVGVNLDDLA